MADVAMGSAALPALDQETLEQTALFVVALDAGGGAGSGTVTTYVNRVWDTQAGPAFVRWETSADPDPSGASYPGPGTFGVHTSDYVVEYETE